MNTNYNSDNCQSQWSDGPRCDSGQQYTGQQYQQGGNYEAYQQGYRDGYQTRFSHGSRQGYNPAKNRTTFGILAILLGWLGIQYFYVDKIGGGFITILLNLVTCGLWSIVTLIQGIIVLSSMTDWEFDEKYVFSRSLLPLF